jgi:SAM-dependent methyltransferase
MRAAMMTSEGRHHASRMSAGKRGRAISVRGDTVVKRQEPGTSRRERLRTLAGRQVGLETGLFNVPDIVSFDDSLGEIVFERLRATKLRQMLTDPDRGMELVGRAARALAAIHGQMEATDPPAQDADSPGPRGSAGRTVPLHGDFGINNLFYLAPSDRLVIIDWANADWIGVDADRGAPEIDLAVFLMSLFLRRVFERSPVFRRYDVARHFLATYTSVSPLGVDLERLSAITGTITPAYARLNREHKGNLRALMRRHSLIDLDLFLRRLCSERSPSRAGATEVDPMEHPRSSLRYTDRHKGRGRDYDETFSPDVNPYRAMVWRLEQRVLNGILGDHLTGRKIAHLDFACGTGRILGFFQGRVASATGVDVSASMMEVARQAAPDAELIEADLTQHDVLGGRSFDLITAFRFFPNAEPELRRAVFLALTRHLAAGGVLVFNNHKNRNSLRRRISRLLGREVARGTMTHAEVEALAAEAGLRILQVIPLATLPLSERRSLLPLWLAEPLERRLSGHPRLAGLAQDLIYVCARPESGRTAKR